MIRKIIEQQISNQIFSEGKRFFEIGVAIINDHEPSLQFPEGTPITEKVQTVLSQMILEEKIALISGETHMGIRGIPRLNLRKLWCSDATAGVHNFRRATAFPVPIAMAATWNRDMIRHTGEIIGEEARAKGVSVLLAPGVNIYRVPTNGRNFEYFGEDPYLTSALIVPFIQGVQSRGVITTVKHFACNNSDYDRHKMDTIIDERTLHELYLPPFKAAVQQGGSKGVMCAYNLINGIHCSEHKALLTDILRIQWGFTGFVISDWDSIYSTEGPLKAGLDLEMPKTKYFSLENIQQKLQSRELTETDIDHAVEHLLHVFFEMGVYERPNKESRLSEFGPEHDAVALDLAREAVVVLKNERNLLPIDPNKPAHIVICGRNAKNTPTSGGGSCYSYPANPSNIFDSLRSLASPAITLTYLEVESTHLPPAMQKMITQADYVILCAGYKTYEESEAFDRSWILPNQQPELITQITLLNKNIIVVVNVGADFETESWIASIPALVHSFYLGQNAGQPVAEIIFGLVNPSGKLPFTMVKKWEDIEATKNYVKRPDTLSIRRIMQKTSPNNRFVHVPIEYKEQLMVGYRHFDTNHIKPQFPFGYGLSYTKFAYLDLEVDSSILTSQNCLAIRVKLKNVGDKAGKEIVQLYIRPLNPPVFRPLKELKDFRKIALAAHETASITFQISPDQLAYYEIERKGWYSAPGDYEVQIGSSSSEIHLVHKISYHAGN